MAVPPISLSDLNEVFEHMVGRVKYKLGAKAPNLDCDSSEIRIIDCSGWSRYAAFRASEGKLCLPEGSQAQRAWCEEAGIHKLAKYSDVAYAIDDPSRLFICFLSPHPGEEWPRHVWFVRAGKTLESCGSGGVCSRSWDNHNLVNCSAAFELPAEV